MSRGEVVVQQSAPRTRQRPPSELPAAAALARRLAAASAWYRVGLWVLLVAITAAACTSLIAAAAILAGLGWVAPLHRDAIAAFLAAPAIAAAAGLIMFVIRWPNSPVAEQLQRLMAIREDDDLLTAAEVLDGRAWASSHLRRLLYSRATEIAARAKLPLLFFAPPWPAALWASGCAALLLALSLVPPDGWTQTAGLTAARLPTAKARPVQSPQAPALPAPAVLKFSLRIEPPSYTRRATVVLRSPAATAAPEGSRIALSARFADARQVKLDWGDQELRGQRDVAIDTQLSAPINWRLAASGPGGQVTVGPYRIDLIADRPPQARIDSPAGPVNLPAPRRLQLAVRARDDYGLSEVSLQWKTSRSRRWHTIPLASSLGPNYSDEISLDLGTMRLAPGDAVSIRLKARDNNAVRGPQTSYSNVLRIQISSPPAERQPIQAVDQAAAREQDAWQRLRQHMAELGEAIDRLDRQAAAGSPASGSATAELADIASRLSRAAEEAKQAMSEAEAALRLSDLVDDEMLEKVAELHRLAREVLDEQMQDIIRRLQQAIKQGNLDSIRADSRKLRQLHDRFMRQLDRTLELLKRARLEMLLEALRRRARHLADRQQQLIQRTEKLSEGDPASRRQADRQAQLAADTRPLPDQLQLAAEKAAELDNEAAQRLEALSRRLRQADPASQMRQAASALARSAPADALPGQRHALQALQGLAGDLAGLQADLTGRQRRELQTAASRAAADATALARAQHRLMQQAAPLSHQTMTRAVQQKELLERTAASQRAVAEGVDRLAAAVGELGKKSPAVEPGLAARLSAIAEAMRQAARLVQGGEVEGAAILQQDALGQLNQLAADLVALSQALGQQSARMALSEYLKRLEQLAEQQRALNQRSAQAGEGNPLLSELGAQQAMLREALSRLMRGAGRQLSDKLGGVGKDMDDVARDLRQRKLTPQTKTKQRDILHKMLDAQRSLYTRRQHSRRRIAESPKPYRPPPSPPAVSSSHKPAIQLPPAPQTASIPVPPEYRDLAYAYIQRIQPTTSPPTPR